MNPDTSMIVAFVTVDDALADWLGRPLSVPARTCPGLHDSQVLTTEAGGAYLELA